MVGRTVKRRLPRHHTLVVAGARHHARQHVFILALMLKIRFFPNLFFKEGYAIPQPRHLINVLLRGGHNIQGGRGSRHLKAGSFKATLTATGIVVAVVAVIEQTGREDTFQPALPGPMTSDGVRNVVCWAPLLLLYELLALSPISACFLLLLSAFPVIGFGAFLLMLPLTPCTFLLPPCLHSRAFMLLVAATRGSSQSRRLPLFPLSLLRPCARC